MDAEIWKSLLSSIETSGNGFAGLLGELKTSASIFDPSDVESQGKLDEKGKLQCPACGHEFTT